ncbi:PREDICTED: glutamate receptor 2.8-like [Populus euphratica]|uniref:Glutamate receptor n=1 Tax=Populus euphratica TaxID=75702 RepID=A0AAJ6Y7I9_POPEU|nr:PREDICTED: glutamate receptor 2.8-like [Populus euphratica]XP_011044965.1 PREDICTED: glutamate receptor 2.8-like [Populus euphratica]
MKKNHSKAVLSFFCVTILFTAMGMAENKFIPVNVGVVLDLDSDLDGRIALSCIEMALSDFYATHGDYKTRLVLNTRDSMKAVVGAAAAGLDLIRNVEVQAILGPTKSMQANFVIDLGEKARVPIMSFSATSPSLASIRSTYFFQATLNDSTQVNAISALVQAFKWREAVPIYVDNVYGEGIIPYLIDAWRAVDARVPSGSAIPPPATDEEIVEELYKLMGMQTRDFIVHMYGSLGTRLFAKAKEIGMMSEGCFWIMTDGLTADLLSSQNPSVTGTMQGVLGAKPYVPSTKEFQDFRDRWKRKFQQDNPYIIDAELNIYGLRGYDAATALALAVEKAGTTNFGFRKANVSSSSSTDLATLGVSFNGPSFLQALSNTSFKGLTGDYHFVDGRLPSPAFRIVNVNGIGGREIGFWTPKEGLVKQFVPSNGTKSNSVFGISTVIFPGDTTAVPKGWGIPTKEKKLRIGVPVKSSLRQFVDVIRYPSSNTTIVTGFCIDIFDTVVKKLPYDLPYEYVPFAKLDGQSAGTYDDLVYQVYLRKFDAVVGDITILYSRSLIIDYTLPFMESGVSVIVPIEGHNIENAWFFLKPLTWDLWVSSLLFFVFIGFVVWVLEHRINGDFRGPASHQTGTIFWFSFSTMVFAQRERVVSNLSRVVVIIWCFVVLILTQSYTASLSSLLTVQQLKVTDVNELIKKGEYVGYHKDSFILRILLGLGFDKSKLIAYSSPEECLELFSKGSGNGGIAAAFNEVPYIKAFLSKYCSKYTMIDATFKTGGFGFVFPKGSPLVPDISREILNMIEGDKMKEIQDKWFANQTSCPDSGTSVSSNSLSIKSFWGLFLIARVGALLALIIFIAMFVHQEGRVALRPSDSTTSIWSKIRHLFSIFNQRDFTSHIEVNGVHLPSMGTASQSGNSAHTEIHGYPSSAGYDTSRNSQAHQVTSADQLTNPNKERPVKENQKSKVNHEAPPRTDQRSNSILHQRTNSY